MAFSSLDPIFKTDSLELLPTPKRVRAMFGGKVVADSKDAAMLFEKGHLPLYYLPKADVDMYFRPPSTTPTAPAKAPLRTGR